MDDGVARVARTLGAMFSLAAAAVSGQEARDAPIAASVNYVFATDLGSGIYDLDGRTLQIYRFTYEKTLREAGEGRVGAQFELPATFGFFDFNPADVVSQGLPSRIDSFSVVPGFELDFLLDDGWHVLPYVRAGFSVASSSVDGWLYGAGFKVQRHDEWRGWQRLARHELNYSAVDYRERGAANDQFVRLRQGFDITRGLGARVRGRELELGLYAIFDVVIDPPTAPLADEHRQPFQAEFGVTLATRPRLKIWRFDAPRVGLGFRAAGPLSAWRIVLGVPF